MKEIEKMRAGELFSQTDPMIISQMLRGYILTKMFNITNDNQSSLRNYLIRKLFGAVSGDIGCVQAPIHIDYGVNIHVGVNFVSYGNLIIQDEGPVYIGDNVVISSNVILTTDLHPLLAEQWNVCYSARKFPNNHRTNYVYARPISIGNNVVIGDSTIICPGVTVGDNTIICPNSIVTNNLPSNVIAQGSPCRVIKELHMTLEHEQDFFIKRSL